ncbi:MAG TPA: polymer-forming cytoskeletal protein [Terriglobia bacterium]|nr:polymer-forming cytoskeletal protein [Terriglobia bacterium]
MSMGLGKSRRRRELEELLDDDVVGLLEPGVEVEGKMKVATGMIRLNSHFKGEIESEGTIVVAEQGDVEADIRAKLISVSGKVKGNIHASDRLEIKEHGIVLGDIFTASLVVDPGGYFDGHCHMPTPEPEKHPAAGLDSKDRT